MDTPMTFDQLHIIRIDAQRDQRGALLSVANLAGLVLWGMSLHSASQPLSLSRESTIKAHQADKLVAAHRCTLGGMQRSKDAERRFAQWFVRINGQLSQGDYPSTSLVRLQGDKAIHQREAGHIVGRQHAPTRILTHVGPPFSAVRVRILLEGVEL